MFFNRCSRLHSSFREKKCNAARDATGLSIVEQCVHQQIIWLVVAYNKLIKIYRVARCFFFSLKCLGSCLQTPGKLAIRVRGTWITVKPLIDNVNIWWTMSIPWQLATFATRRKIFSSKFGEREVCIAPERQHVLLLINLIWFTNNNRIQQIIRLVSIW